MNDEKDYRMDCPMCGHQDGVPFYVNQVCNHCLNDLNNDEWEHHSSYQKEEEGDEDE